jgi:hypothetical protein
VNTKGLLIFFGIPVLTITALLFINNLAFVGGDNQSANNQNQQSSANASVPLPSDTDLITMFFQALSEKNMALVLGMLDPSLLTTQENVKAWADQFGAFELVTLEDIQPSNQNEWTDTERIYKIAVNAKMSPESANATIPYYGWGDGDTVKWMTVRKGEDGLWRVVGFASGM